jgi:SAM-dependent methyltransferase
MISRILKEHRKGLTRPQDVMLLMSAVGIAACLTAAAGRSFLWSAGAGLFSVAALIGARAFGRRYPAPMGGALRWTLFVVPHASRFLAALLDPKRGERILEIGPGVGQHALFMARRVGPAGAVEVLDVQHDMLEAVVRRAAAAGVTNVVARRGDAQDLPYRDASFDAAYLSAVLGEIPNPDAALRELRRVLKRGGRLVVAEVFLDPEFVSLMELREKTERTGFVFDGKRGLALAYAARFRCSREDDAIEKAHS